MARSSGVNLLASNNNWSGSQIFGPVTENQQMLFNTMFDLASALHTSALTLTGGAPVHRFDVSGGAFTVTLPAAPVPGQVYFFKLVAVGANSLTIAGNGHNIDGAASLVLGTQFQAVVLRYDSSAAVWDVLAQVATTIL